ncbi:MAG: DUF3631 domain-containing protein [Acidobacteriia bacterium]|nr:DUF3631 domain-containing protein [Terriglobia bacterium]
MTSNPFAALERKRMFEARETLREHPELRAEVDAHLSLPSRAIERPRPAEDGAGLLRDLRSFVQRYVVLSHAQATALALWILHTHVISSFDVTPYLNINSAEKQCGKTRLLEVLKITVANPWMTGRVTAAVLVRKVDAEHPTLLLDESDAAFNGEKEYAEALRGILNTGYLGDGKASLCVGQGAQITFKDFSTFCPKAIAGIGKLPDTVEDRSIPIRLRRAAPGEVVARFRRRNVESEVAPLRERIEKWSSMVVDSLAQARPLLPDCLSDRQQDVVEPLLAIADAAGGEWPKESQAALLEIFGAAQGDESVGVRLLADIRAVLGGDEENPRRERISSADLAEALGKIETSPWGEWSKGKPLTPAKLARLLSRFGITPTVKRIAGSPNQRGYERTDFEDAWTRYLPRIGLQNVTASQANVYGPSSDFSKYHAETDVTAQKCEIANTDGRCDVVTLLTPIRGTEEGKEGTLEGEL